MCLIYENASGRSAAWLAHWSGGPGVGGSNPLAPTIYQRMEHACVLKTGHPVFAGILPDTVQDLH